MLAGRFWFQKSINVKLENITPNYTDVTYSKLYKQIRYCTCKRF